MPGRDLLLGQYTLKHDMPPKDHEINSHMVGEEVGWLLSAVVSRMQC
jgi:hypothetical protein